MHSQPHPDLELLDLLRAGLLDDTPDEKAALESHLAGCPACRAQAGYWRNLVSLMESPRQHAALQEQLSRARQAALAARPGALNRSLVPYAVAAALLAAVTLGILGLPTGEVPAPSATTQTAQVIPDTYEDLDFYLWLANQDEGHSEQARTSPNNT
jgi:anti-sigma factor RsiW